jgi:cysteinyl-tRNA synthetase
MVRSIYGDSIDIHGGGSDLIFPHHENEIAQSEGATEKPLARYWMHNNMLTFGEKKMSKSLGNIMTTRDFLSKYDAEILKFMMLSVHYRSLSDFSSDGIHIAVGGLGKFYSALNLAEKTMAGATPDVAQSAAAPTKAFAEVLKASEAASVSALNDDFNTPELFAALYAMIRAFNTAVRPGMKVTPEIYRTAHEFRQWVLRKGRLMALFQEPADAYLRQLDDRLLNEKKIERSAVDQIVRERTQARAAKDFKRSDELRDQLVEMGISVFDTSQGTTWEVSK